MHFIFHNYLTCVCPFKLSISLINAFYISELFNLNFIPKPLDKKHLASVHNAEDLDNGSFHPSKPGELLLLEVPGLARFTPNHILAGIKRTIYFSSDTSKL